MLLFYLLYNIQHFFNKIKCLRITNNTKGHLRYLFQMSYALEKNTIDPSRLFCEGDKQNEFVGLRQTEGLTMNLKELQIRPKQFWELNGTIQLTTIDGSNQRKICFFYI